MNEYSVTVSFVDKAAVQVKFDSFDEFHSYITRIGTILNTKSFLTKDEFIDLGNRECYIVPIRTIKTISSNGYVIAGISK